MEKVAKINADAVERAAKVKADAMDRSATINANAMDKQTIVMDRAAMVNAEAMDRGAKLNADAIDRAAMVNANAMSRQIVYTSMYGQANAYWLQGFVGVLGSAALLYLGYQSRAITNQYFKVRDPMDKIRSLAAGPKHLQYSRAMTRIHEHRNGFPDPASFYSWFASEINSGKRTPKWKILNDDRTVCLDYLSQVEFAKLNATAFPVERSVWAIEYFKKAFNIPDERKLLQTAMGIFEKKLAPKKGHKIIHTLSELFDQPDTKLS